MTGGRIEPDGIDGIDGVIEALDAAVSWAHVQASPLGYFAALYRSVTARVAEGIEAGFFDDGPRMERLDVVFARRYLSALDRHRAGGRPTRSWDVAFGAADDATTTVLQQLLVGISAHINLDLGIAAAAVAPGQALPRLRRDFDRINEILASMMRRAQADLAVVSPWLGLLDALGGRTDDEIVRFSIEVARSEAWAFAVELAPLEQRDWAAPVASRDRIIARLGQKIRRPGLLTGVLWLIRLRESKNVRRNLDVLAHAAGPSLGEVEARVNADPSLKP